MGARNILQKLRGSSDKSLSTKDVVNKFSTKIKNAARTEKSYSYTKDGIKDAQVFIKPYSNSIEIEISGLSGELND